MSLADKAVDLAEELQRLREEHRRVTELNEELHAELLQAHVQQGRTLLANSDGPSLASEIHGKDKDEVSKTLDSKTTPRRFHRLNDSLKCRRGLISFRILATLSFVDAHIL